MVWMTAFHFCFDLSYLRLWPQDFYNDPWWTWQRTAIVSLFLLCAGLGQAVAAARHVPWPRFARRVGVVAACAVLVSVGSYLVFPQSYIYFGVLHGMVAMLLLLRALRGVTSGWLLALAALAIALPLLFSAYAAALPPELLRWLQSKPMSVLGLVLQKPRTEDYVPLLPWLGVMLLGYVAGRHWLQLARPLRVGWAAWVGRHPLGRGLAWLGRHSLPYYMVHQLVLLGALTLWVQWFR